MCIFYLWWFNYINNIIKKTNCKPNEDDIISLRSYKSQQTISSLQSNIANKKSIILSKSRKIFKTPTKNSNLQEEEKNITYLQDLKSYKPPLTFSMGILIFLYYLYFGGKKKIIILNVCNIYRSKICYETNY